MIVLVQISPVVIGKVAFGGGAGAVFRYAAGFAAHDGIAGLRFPEFAVFGLVVEGACVIRGFTETVIVSRQTGFRAPVMGRFGGQGILDRQAVHAHLELRGTELNLTGLGKCVQQGVRQILARFIVGVRLGIETEVGGVVPFAPRADETGLKHEDDVLIGLEIRL